MISQEHNTIFIHIPRNAGGSISQALYGEDYKSPTQENMLKKHASIKDIKNQNIKGYENYYKWTIVRNPWERELSMYYAKQQRLTFVQHLRMNVKPFTKIHHYPYGNQVDYIMVDDYIELDQIVRMEFINDSWPIVCKNIGFKNITLKTVNESINAQEYGSLYDQEAIDIVAEIRKRDIEFLNYDYPY